MFDAAEAPRDFNPQDSQGFKRFFVFSSLPSSSAIAGLARPKFVVLLTQDARRPRWISDTSESDDSRCSVT